MPVCRVCMDNASLVPDTAIAVQMNMDPRLDVELGTPVLQEMQEPTADDMLQLSGPLAQTMGITNEQDWQVHRHCLMLATAVAQQAVQNSVMQQYTPGMHQMQSIAFVAACLRVPCYRQMLSWLERTVQSASSSSGLLAIRRRLALLKYCTSAVLKEQHDSSYIQSWFCELLN